jgi:DNA-binding NarL/FixJ family response regulator
MARSNDWQHSDIAVRLPNGRKDLGVRVQVTERGTEVTRATMLLVDDTPDVRAVLRLTTELDDRFEVVAEAADGSEAIAFAAVHQPSAIVLDIMMPRMSGLQALPALRRISPASVIVCYSSRIVEGVEDEAVRAGADAYITKRDGPASVLDIVETLILRPRQARGNV